MRAAGTLALAVLVALAAVAGSFRGAGHRLDELSFSVLDRPASGQVHVVEMDAASMAAIQSWPWPRDHYARLVDQLDAAGVRSISFDVDFSGASDPAKDRAFGDAIAAAQATVALPTFAQKVGFNQVRELDTLPIAPLRAEAYLASVSISPDRDGFLRRMPLGTITASTARPSIAAFVAGRSGVVGPSFPIDYAVDPASIPRHSFIAIERGMFRPEALRDKDVIVGATAVETGDRYLVPRHGVIHGVIVQALAAETLGAAVPTYGGWVAPLGLATIVALLFSGARRRLWVVQRAAAGTIALLAVWIAARVLGAVWFEVIPALTLIGAAAVLRLAILTNRFAELGRRMDAESGLPNRLALDAQRETGGDRYVIAAQIDDFDALKLAVGAENVGELLRRLVERLTVAASATTVYRIEDRTLVWRTPLEMNELEPVMAGLRAIMRSPFEVAGRKLGVSFTFGVAAAGAPGATSNAAHAAAQAKRTGKPWRFHADGEGETAAEHFSLLGELDDALRDGDIMAFYQPKQNLATGRIDAVEALVRWRHPVRGMLPPDFFIPVIEESGRIDDLTLGVLAIAIADMRKWCEQDLVIGVAVNISAGLLTSDSFAAKALALVARAGVPAQRLTFEVTESAQFEDTEKAIAVLETFRAAGINISMDDYGTGQSTLNYLKLLPVTELKIDRSFVQHAHIDRGDAMLVRSTVQLAHELDIKVVAEGIEDAACLAFLKAIGCDYAQGYFVSHPLPADELAALVSQPAGIAA
ncbi:putative bifunctional diguanylate cyclase/phosphodiesterase [Porphyrobacter sp. AAP60]|uniref:putative bifunctional diguanylate cyclase/phosphodiesterase n=1 Tax=Porphyrobacter sp. AAP60 TaxID=1523423 RepID=UPI0006B8C813|nr:EAL domain-containing protein [Porphyrobacter sp. AAP60]